jgi:hypothetical protein
MEEAFNHPIVSHIILNSMVAILTHSALSKNHGKAENELKTFQN